MVIIPTAAVQHLPFEVAERNPVSLDDSMERLLAFGTWKALWDDFNLKKLSTKTK